MNNDAKGRRKVKFHLLTSIISLRNSTEIDININKWFSSRNTRDFCCSMFHHHLPNQCIHLHITNPIRNNYYLVKLEELTKQQVEGKVYIWLNEAIYFLQNEKVFNPSILLALITLSYVQVRLLEKKCN